MLYILSGQDDFSLGQALEEIKRGIGDRVAVEANTTTLEGRQVTLEQLRAACEMHRFWPKNAWLLLRGCWTALRLKTGPGAGGKPRPQPASRMSIKQ